MDREGGYIKIHRKALSSPLFLSLTGEQRSVMLHLIALANWKDSAILYEGTWHKICRGELFHSIQTIADSSAVSVKVVRTAIEKLSADDSGVGGNGPFLKTRILGKGTGKAPRVITLCNYCKYQDVFEETGKGTGKAWGKGGAKEGQRTGKGGAPIEEGKEEEEGKEGEEGEALSANADAQRTLALTVVSSKPTEPTPDELQALWNKIAPPAGLPAWESPTTGERLKHAKARLRERRAWTLRGESNSWEAFYRRIAVSDYLRGLVNGFTASSGWVLKPENFAKICEGNYDNREPKQRDWTKGRVGAEEVDKSNHEEGTINAADFF